MNISSTILRQIESRKLDGLSLPPEFILPDYNGGSIANLSSQVAQWLGAPPFAVSPLHNALTASLGDGIRQVIMVLVDAMGYERFQNLFNERNSVWSRLTESGVLAPLTSVFPSTTTAALTSVWSGHAPGEHGMLGYEMWLKEYGATSNMINFSPMSVSFENGLLLGAGFEPEKFLSMPTLGTHLQSSGIETHSFLPGHIINSGLSQMHMSGTKMHGYHSVAELWHTQREFLNSTSNQKQFVWTYYPMVDTLSHAYGPAVEWVEDEARAFGEMMMTACLDRLDKKARGDTVFVVVADHGQVDTPREDHLDLSRHREFTEMLHLMPSGENRAAYLHCRPNKVDAVRDYIMREWGDQFCVVAQEDALKAGLYGKKLDVKTASRLGEWLVLSRGNSYWWWANKENKMKGRHGGLGRQEMLVPFIAGRLDRW